MLGTIRKTLTFFRLRRREERKEELLDRPLAVVTLRQLVEVLGKKQVEHAVLGKALTEVDRHIHSLELNLDKPLKDRWQLVKDLRESFDQVPGYAGFSKKKLDDDQ